MKIPRTSALATLLLAANAAAADTTLFNVLLDSRPIGTHSFEFTRSADGALEVHGSAKFAVRFLGITAYRYKHEANEQWRNDCVVKINTSTDDNGKALHVQRTFADSCVSSYAYWNRDLLIRQQQLFNPQTGELDAVQIQSLGEETISVRGSAVAAARYQLRSAKLTIDLWYSRSGEWLQLDTTTASSRKLQYRLAP